MVTLSGLGSGLDTAAIIQQLLAGPRSLITRTQSSVTAVKTAQSAFKDINGRLQSLLERTRDLSTTNLQLKKAITDTASGSPTVLNASAGAGAAVGAFSVVVEALATATTVTGAASAGAAINQGVPLASAGFALTPTAGTFSVNGTAITIDSSTVLSDGVDSAGSNTILAKINHAGLGVTASIVNDPDGRPNRIELTSATAIQLGSGADTSNFLAAAKLLASPGTTTRTSTGNLGVVNPAAKIGEANLAGALGATAGAFTVNGVSIAWDSTTETLNDIISKVNSSSAGVVMAYDATADRFKLTNKSTGSTAISVADSTGTLAQALRLTDGTATLGSNARYTVDGGATQYSTSNTVTEAVPGVTLNFVSASVTPVKVTVSQDIDAITQKVQDWVAQYNSVTGLIRSSTAYVAGGASGPLLGDSGVNSVLSGLTQRLTSQPAGVSGPYTLLSQIGLSFGAAGAAVGTTTTLQFDTAKFKEAMANDPASVIGLLTANGGGATGFVTEMKTYLESLTKTGGTFSSRISEQDKRIKLLNDQITRMQSSLAGQQSLLEKKFQRMEAALSKLQSQQAQLASLTNLG